MQLPIRTCDTVTRNGSHKRTLSVFCPRRVASVDTRSCQDCAYAHAVRSTVVECSPPIETVDSAADVSAGAVSSVAVICAHRDVPASEVLSRLPPQWGAVPIVDTQDRFLGFLSVTRMANIDLPPRIVQSLPVGELTFGRALAIPEDEALRSAIRSMAVHRARVIALLDGAGVVRGMLTDMDALRALAHSRRD